MRRGTITIGARHAGLVLALALVAPLLSHDLTHAGHESLLGGTRVILDGNAPLRQKVPIALDLRTAIESAPNGVVPDLAEPFDRRGAAQRREPAAPARRPRRGDPRRADPGLPERVPALGDLRRRGADPDPACEAPGRQRCHDGPRAGRSCAGSPSSPSTLLAAELALGGLRYGTARLADPCTAKPAFEGGGIDGAVQRFALSGLAGAACSLGTSREELVLSFSPSTRDGAVRWDRATIDRALRAGLDRASHDTAGGGFLGHGARIRPARDRREPGRLVPRRQLTGTDPLKLAAAGSPPPHRDSVSDGDRPRHVRCGKAPTAAPRQRF